jgi:UDP-N-acetylglucosamine diphosphorylase/glucosamine-1-phosphate N-acetyltransferase
MEERVIILLAGGLGKRMHSDIPKVLNKINNIPMLVILLREIYKDIDNIEKILIVVGKYKPIIESTLLEYNVLYSKIKFIYQEQALGTGHAVLCCRDYLLTFSNSSKVLILYGDTPFISRNTISNMFLVTNINLLTTFVEDPTGFGRIIENKDNLIDKIIEHRDCTEAQLKINKVNCGIYCVKNHLLVKYLLKIENKNNQNEYYLTDIIALINKGEKLNIEEYTVPKKQNYEVLGINTKTQLETLERLYINSHLNG